MLNCSGNGAGKTFGIAAVLGAICFPDIAPECFRRSPFIDFKGPKRARIISTPAELQDIGSLQASISHLWPSGRYDGDKGGKNFQSRFWTDTGWVIDLMSYEQDISEFAGPSLGVVVFNEPPSKPIYDESIARTRAGGKILAAMTSLRENPWVVDGLIGKANGKDIRCTFGDIEDNCKDHGINGTLEHDQIERILSQYDPDERDARKTGKPLRFSGRIYKVFSRDIHVAKEPILVPREGVSHYMSVDPAIGKPVFGLWAFIGVDGVLNVYDEYPEFEFEGAKDRGLTLRDYSAAFKTKEHSNGVKGITRIIDRHFGNARRNMGGLTLKDEWLDPANGGLEFVDSYHVADASSELETGIEGVKSWLRWNAAADISSLNRPKLIISPTCVNTIKALERWTRDPDTLKPTEAYKDGMDCLRYIVKAEPKYDPPSDWGNYEQPYYGVES